MKRILWSLNVIKNDLTWSAYFRMIDSIYLNLLFSLRGCASTWKTGFRIIMSKLIGARKCTWLSSKWEKSRSEQIQNVETRKNMESSNIGRAERRRIFFLFFSSVFHRRLRLSERRFIVFVDVRLRKQNSKRPDKNFRLRRKWGKE